MKPAMMYVLERRCLESGNRLWHRYAVSANRRLLEKVLAGQPTPQNWRVVPLACSVGNTSGTLPKSA